MIARMITRFLIHTIKLILYAYLNSKGYAIKLYIYNPLKLLSKKGGDLESDQELHAFDCHASVAAQKNSNFDLEKGSKIKAFIDD